tara:strand:+ start:48 stop:755 length:708 start_codon:yes stop_codon:yes gene_type:complete
MPSHYGSNGNGRGMGMGRTTTTTRANANPVTRLFQAPSSPRYYRPDGSIVAVGAPLHQHRDGTIMTEHSMDGTGEDASVVVTTRRITRTTNGNRNRVNTRTNVGNRTGYVIAGTNERYTGLVVMRGGIPYSTKSGVYEGNSLELTATAPSTNVQPASVRLRGGTISQTRAAGRNSIGVTNTNRSTTISRRGNAGNRVNRRRVQTQARQRRNASTMRRNTQMNRTRTTRTTMRRGY